MTGSSIPASLLQGDSASWNDSAFTDSNSVAYDSAHYTLKYTISGPSAAPLVLTATPNGLDWITAITTAQSAALIAGTYWWQMQVSATNVRVTVAEGQLLVKPDLATVGASYDGRTVAQKALADAEAALATFQKSGGRVQSYTIGNRQMSFQRDAEILDIVKYWRERVASERSAADGSKSRRLHIRFDRIR